MSLFKRAISVILAVMMVAALVLCGESDNGGTTSEGGKKVDSGKFS